MKALLILLLACVSAGAEGLGGSQSASGGAFTGGTLTSATDVNAPFCVNVSTFGTVNGQAKAGGVCTALEHDITAGIGGAAVKFYTVASSAKNNVIQAMEYSGSTATWLSANMYTDRPNGIAVLDIGSNQTSPGWDFKIKGQSKMTLSAASAIAGVSTITASQFNASEAKALYSRYSVGIGPSAGFTYIGTSNEFSYVNGTTELYKFTATGVQGENAPIRMNTGTISAPSYGMTGANGNGMNFLSSGYTQILAGNSETLIVQTASATVKNTLGVNTKLNIGQPGNTIAMVNIASGTINFQGTGKPTGAAALCLNAAGNLATCSSVVGADGTCTCN